MEDDQYIEGITIEDDQCIEGLTMEDDRCIEGVMMEDDQYINTLRTGDAEMSLYAYKKIKCTVPSVLRA
jgi:hypothetical protein